LIESFAAAVSHDLLEQALHSLDPLHEGVEFRELSLAQLLPTLCGLGDTAKTKEQLPNLIQ
jgi:hypothetical protein